jgi:hypothetical protein
MEGSYISENIVEMPIEEVDAEKEDEMLDVSNIGKAGEDKECDNVDDSVENDNLEDSVENIEDAGENMMKADDYVKGEIGSFDNEQQEGILENDVDTMEDLDSHDHQPTMHQDRAQPSYMISDNVDGRKADLNDGDGDHLIDDDYEEGYACVERDDSKDSALNTQRAGRYPEVMSPQLFDQQSGKSVQYKTEKENDGNNYPGGSSAFTNEDEHGVSKEMGRLNCSDRNR